MTGLKIFPTSKEATELLLTSFPMQTRPCLYINSCSNSLETPEFTVLALPQMFQSASLVFALLIEILSLITLCYICLVLDMRHAYVGIPDISISYEKWRGRSIVGIYVAGKV